MSHSTRARGWPLLLAAVLLLLAAGCARKGREAGTIGTPVRITVLDEAGNPIPTAVIRHPDEADRHRVNAVDGSWSDELLYMPDGSELVFEPGLLLTFEISAPGYEAQVIQYQVRKRRNEVEVVLHRLELDDSEIEDPMISFGRDTPREDPVGTGPAN